MSAWLINKIDLSKVYILPDRKIPNGKIPFDVVNSTVCFDSCLINHTWSDNNSIIYYLQEGIKLIDNFTFQARLTIADVSISGTRKRITLVDEATNKQYEMLVSDYFTLLLNTKIEYGTTELLDWTFKSSQGGFVICPDKKYIKRTYRKIK